MMDLSGDVVKFGLVTVASLAFLNRVNQVLVSMMDPSGDVVAFGLVP